MNRHVVAGVCNWTQYPDISFRELGGCRLAQIVSVFDPCVGIDICQLVTWFVKGHIKGYGPRSAYTDGVDAPCQGLTVARNRGG